MSRVFSAAGTILAPTYFEGLVDDRGEQHRRYFTYRTDMGLVSGTTTNVLFTLNRPASDVWPHFKDFNCWQNSYHHYYSGVAGDLEGKTIRLTVGSDLNDPTRPSANYTVDRVIPEHLIEIAQLMTKEGPFAGMGGLSVFMLNEQRGQTTVSILMQHDLLTQETSEEKALAYWRPEAPENLLKWGEFFIPTLRRLVCGESSEDSPAA